jgi:predicted kinase
MLIKLKTILKSSEHNVVVMVGPPLSGKSTIIKEIKDYAEIVSRDDIVMELGNGLNYKDSFKTVNQKDVDKLLKKRMVDLGKTTENVVIDMTNLSPKRRKNHLAKFPKHYKIACVLDIPKIEVLFERNEKRFKEEEKFISKGVIETMYNSIKYPTKEEGFDNIIQL